MIKGVHHITITVRNLDHSIDFYSRVLGFQEAKRYQYPQYNMRAVMMQNGTDRIELLSADYVTQKPNTDATSLEGELKTSGIKHMAFEAGSLEKTCDMLVSRGVEVMSPPAPGVNCRWVAFIKDPDGNLIELHEPY